MTWNWPNQIGRNLALMNKHLDILKMNFCINLDIYLVMFNILAKKISLIFQLI